MSRRQSTAVTYYQNRRRFTLKQYRYPIGSKIVYCERPKLSYDISYKKHEYVVKYAKRLAAVYPYNDIYITLPSKVNTDAY